MSVRLEPRADGTQSAGVELWRHGHGESSGEKFVGSAQALDPRRAVAEATLDALRRAFQDRASTLDLLTVQTREAFGGAVLVSVALSGRHGDQSRFLVGTSRVIGYDPASAVARSVLDATNRFLAPSDHPM